MSQWLVNRTKGAQNVSGTLIRRKEHKMSQWHVNPTKGAQNITVAHQSDERSTECHSGTLIRRNEHRMSVAR